jgi:mycothiol synthase
MPLHIRNYQPDDLPALVDMLNAAEQVDNDGFHYTVDEMRHQFADPIYQPETVCFLAFAESGQLIGFCDVMVNSDYGWWAWGCVHPDYRRQGVGTRLLQTADSLATGGHVDRIINAVNVGACMLLEKQGYTALRDHYEMRIALDKPSPAPPFPAGITLRPFVPERDTRAVYEAHQEAFHDHWGHVETPFEAWIHEKLDDPRFDPTLWFVAVQYGQVAGLSLCRMWDSKQPELGHVDEFAVRSRWRKQGLGLALLQHSFHVMQARGFTAARLGVDAESNSNAVSLYQRAGMHLNKRWIIYRKDFP